MFVKVGFLCVPQHDKVTTKAIYHMLRKKMSEAYVVEETSASSQRHWLEEILRQWCDEVELDLIITIGGTFPAPGPGTAEIVPKATSSVLERLLPGFSEAMRAHACKHSELALLDCGVCGIRGRTLIMNLPHGASAATLFLSAVIDAVPAAIQHLQDRPNAPILEGAVSTEAAASNVEGQALALSGRPESVQQPEKPERRTLDPEEFAAHLRRIQQGGKE